MPRIRHPILITLLVVLGGALLLLASRGLGRIDDPSLAPRFDASRAALPPERSSVPANPRRTAFFGDLHVHTSYSSDAYVFGVRALPDDAFTFAKGGTIEHGAGYPIRLSRPLDFLAVTDHAEYLGTYRAAEPDVPTARRPLRDVLENGNRFDFTRYWIESVGAIFEIGELLGGDVEVERDAWEEIIAAANRHDDPGTFTAFIGYEWSSDGIHRNVVYGSERAPKRPYSALDSNRPQDLWAALEAQRIAGQPVIAIPHNGNESGGRIYPEDPIEGLSLGAEEARLRSRIEPVSEIYQIKGTSETHPSLSPDDPFADFEIIDLPAYRGVENRQAGSYARYGLRTGLELAFREGANPYAYGFVGSTDSHNASSPVEEDRHHGKLPILDGTAAIRLGEAHLVPNGIAPASAWGGGGLAVIFAEENTRASLFAALERRETYATSGPRIRIRFFGRRGEWGDSNGHDDPNALLESHDLLDVADRQGVPMGADLPRGSEAGTPEFLVWAEQDPQGARLDRIQIVKGSLDRAGRSYERIYDVAAESSRRRDPETGRFEDVGNTVDVAKAEYANDIGSRALRAHFRDPDFDPERDGFYYVRVLEIPTPRASTYDAARLGVDAPEPATIQERAATSPIWYHAPKR